MPKRLLAILAIAACALLALAAAAYWPGLYGGFLFDDFANLPALGSSGPIDNGPAFWRYITSGFNDPFGRPLTLLSFLLDGHDWPTDPFPFKRTSLVLHLVNGVLLGLLLARLGRLLSIDTRRTTAAPACGLGPPCATPVHAAASAGNAAPADDGALAWRINLAALLGAALWLLHPLFVSTTLYVVQREAMLPATFILLGLLAWLHGRERLRAGHIRRGVLWVCLGLGGGTLLATFSKANGALLPLYALAIECTVLTRRPFAGSGGTGTRDAPPRRHSPDSGAFNRPTSGHSELLSEPVDDQRHWMTRRPSVESPAFAGMTPKEGPADAGMTPKENPAAEGTTPKESPAASEMTAREGPAAAGMTSKESPASPGMTSRESPATEGMTSGESPATEGMTWRESPLRRHSRGSGNPVALAATAEKQKHWMTRRPSVESPASAGMTPRGSPASPGTTSGEGPAAGGMAGDGVPAAGVGVATEGGGRGLPKRAYHAAMWVLAVIPGLAIVAHVLWVGVQGVLSGDMGIRTWTIGQRLLTEPRVLWDYLSLLWLPRPFSHGLFNDQFVASTSLLHPATTLPALLGVLALIAGAWWLRRRQPALALAVLFYFAGQLIESTSLPLELYFEHRNYVPALVMFWPLGLWLADTHQLRWAKVGLMLVLPLGLAVMTHARAELWGNEQSQALLWAHNNPDSPRAQANAAQLEIAAGHPEIALRRLAPLLVAEPDQVQLAFNMIAARCALGGVAWSDVEAARVAMRTAANPGALLVTWFGRTLPEVAAGRCPGLDLDDMQNLIDAGTHNPRFAGPGLRQDLAYLQGRVALLRQQPDAALADFMHALDVNPRPAAALQSAAMLGSSGYPAQGLALLDHYRDVQGMAPRPGPGMPRLHAWILEHQGYWAHELAHLRGQLELDAADARPNTLRPSAATPVP